MIEYNQHNLQKICKLAIEIAYNAGDEILSYYNNKKVADIKLKSDHSPVTSADIASDRIIEQQLNNLLINNIRFTIPVLSEEGSDITTLVRRQWSDYWLIDPLDGTKDYIDRNGEFCVNIALISNKKPIMGIIYSPYFDTLYYAMRGLGAYKIQDKKSPQKIVTNKLDKNNKTITIVTSKRHNKVSKYNDFIEILNKKNIQYNVIFKGSALKFGLLAEGKADLYPRFGLTSEWDTASGDCILQEAGGCMKDLNGNKFLYNNKDSLINPEFYAVGDEEYNWQELIK